jgi:hypothetical protein
MMRTRTFGLVVVVALSALLVGLPRSGAQESGTGFVALAAASGGRLSFTVPAFAVVENVIDGGGPVAQAVLDTGSGGTSFASLPYPGENGIAFPGLFSAVTGQSLPFGYPFYTGASHPTTPASSVRDPSGVYALDASADGGQAAALAQLKGPTDQGGGSGSVSRVSVVTEGDRVTASAETLNQALSLGSGALTLVSVRSRSVTVYRRGGSPASSTELAVEGGKVAGYSFSYGRDGLVVAGQGIPLPAGSGLAQLNKALEPSGLQLRMVSPAPVAGGASAASLEVVSTQASPASGIPGSVLHLRLGGATSAVALGVGSAAPSLDVPPATPSAPLPDSAPPAGPAAGSSTSEPGSASAVPAFASPRRDRPSLDGAAVDTLPVEAGTANATAVSPAAPSTQAVAATQVEPLLRPRRFDSLSLAYGSAVVLGAIALGLAALWRAKGVVT